MTALWIEDGILKNCGTAEYWTRRLQILNRMIAKSWTGDSRIFAVLC
jgi:hypothetical protein